MPKRSEEYWQKRFEEILVSNEKLGLNYEKEMAGIYEQTKQNLQKELESFYQRYANQTGLDLAEVKKQLNPAQLKRFRVQQQVYLDKVKKLIEQGADLSKYEETLKKLSARAYVTKLQELQNNLNSEITLLTGEQQVKLTQTLGDSYLQGYFKSVYALQKGIGFGYSFTVPNNQDVKKVLQTPWNGNNYSKSIWNNKAKLTNWLNTDLPRHFAAGNSVQQMSNDLVNKVETNYKNAVRLVRTEVNYITNQSTMDAYEEQNVDRYQILATLDSRTSEICRDLDGKIVDVKDRQVAVNMPPFHVNCRTTTIPYFEDEEWEDLERVARDDKGNNYTVPANMTYNEWNEKYGQGAKVKQGKTVPGPQDTKPVDQTSVPVKEPEYKFMTQEDIDNWSEEVVPNLTTEQHKAIYGYTSNDFYNINAHLRGRLSYQDPDIIESVKQIQSAMSELPQDSKLYRIMGKWDFLNAFKDDDIFALRTVGDMDLWKSKLLGKTFTDKAFQSVSWAGESKYIQNRVGEDSVLFRIRAAKGTKALPVEKFALVAEEKEVILNAGNRFIITDIKTKATPRGNQVILDLLLNEGL